MNRSKRFALIIALVSMLCLTAFGQYSIERSSFSTGTPKSGGTYEMKESAAGQTVSKPTFFEAPTGSTYVWQGFVQINNIPVIFSATAIDSYPDPVLWNYRNLDAGNPTYIRYKSYSNLSGGEWKESNTPVYGTTNMDTIWIDEYSEWEYFLNSGLSEEPGYLNTRWRAKTSDAEYSDTVDYTDWLTTKHQDYFQQYRAQIDVVYSPSGSHDGEVDVVRWYQFGENYSSTAEGTGLDEYDDWFTGTPGAQWADAGSDLEFPEHTVRGTEEWYTVNLREWEQLDKAIDKQITYGQPIPANLDANMVVWRGYSLMGVPLYPVEDTTAYSARHRALYGTDPPYWPPATRGDQDLVLFDDFWQTCESFDGGWPGKYNSWWQISKYRGDIGAYAVYRGPEESPQVEPFWPGHGYWLVQDHCDEMEITVLGIKPSPTNWMEIPLTKWNGLAGYSGMFYNMCANPFYKDVVGGDTYEVYWHNAEIIRYNAGVAVETLSVEDAVSATWINATIQTWREASYFTISCLVGESGYGEPLSNWEGFWLQTSDGVGADDSLVLRMKTTIGPEGMRVRPSPIPDVLASWKANIGIFSEEAGQFDRYNSFGFKEFADEAQAENRMFVEKLPDYCYPGPYLKMFFTDERDTRYSEFYTGERSVQTIYNAVLDCESIKDQKVAVRWNIEYLPEGFTMFIEDPDHGIFMDMLTNSEYTFTSTMDKHKVRIIVTAPIAWVSKEGEDRGDLPKEFFLAGPTPNPFNSASRIEFGIPESESGPVKIEIFDITGRKVRTLMDRDLDAGFYDVTWRGVDNSGAEVASGTYFVRFTSPHRDENRRVSLIK